MARDSTLSERKALWAEEEAMPAPSQVASPSPPAGTLRAAMIRLRMAAVVETGLAPPATISLLLVRSRDAPGEILSTSRRLVAESLPLEAMRSAPSVRLTWAARK